MFEGLFRPIFLQSHFHSTGICRRDNSCHPSLHWHFFPTQSTSLHGHAGEKIMFLGNSQQDASFTNLSSCHFKHGLGSSLEAQIGMASQGEVTAPMPRYEDNITKKVPGMPNFTEPRSEVDFLALLHSSDGSLASTFAHSLYTRCQDQQQGCVRGSLAEVKKN